MAALPALDQSQAGTSCRVACSGRLRLECDRAVNRRLATRAPVGPLAPRQSTFVVGVHSPIPRDDGRSLASRSVSRRRGGPKDGTYHRRGASGRSVSRGVGCEGGGDRHLHSSSFFSLCVVPRYFSCGACSPYRCGSSIILVY